MEKVEIKSRSSINSNDINNLKVCISKSKDTQKKIVKILSAFSAKIISNIKLAKLYKNS